MRAARSASSAAMSTDGLACPRSRTFTPERSLPSSTATTKKMETSSRGMNRLPIEANVQLGMVAQRVRDRLADQVRHRDVHVRSSRPRVVDERQQTARVDLDVAVDLRIARPPPCRSSHLPPPTSPGADPSLACGERRIHAASVTGRLARAISNDPDCRCAEPRNPIRPPRLGHRRRSHFSTWRRSRAARGPERGHARSAGSAHTPREAPSSPPRLRRRASAPAR